LLRGNAEPTAPFIPYDIDDLMQGGRIARNVQLMHRTHTDITLPEKLRVLIQGIEGGHHSASLNQLIEIGETYHVPLNIFLANISHLDKQIKIVNERTAFKSLPKDLTPAVLKNIGRRFRHQRLSMGKNISDVLNDTGISWHTIDRIEKGSPGMNDITREVFLTLVDYYGTSPFYILTGKAILNQSFEIVSDELLMERLAHNLSRLRHLMNYTQEQMEEYANLNEKSYDKYESGILLLGI